MSIGNDPRSTAVMGPAVPISVFLFLNFPLDRKFHQDHRTVAP
jgi:hypothetical protein